MLGIKFQNALNKVYSKEDPKTEIASIDVKHRKIAGELIKKAKPFDNIVSIDSEYIVDFGLGIPVKFVPDLLTENEIVENKYTSGYYNEVMVKKQMQGTMYYWGIKKLFGKSLPVKYQIFNHRNKTVKIVELKKTTQDLAKMMTWMMTTLWKIHDCYETGMWGTRQHGKWDCDLGKACPIKYPDKGLIYSPGDGIIEV